MSARPLSPSPDRGAQGRGLAGADPVAALEAIAQGLKDLAEADWARLAAKNHKSLIQQLEQVSRATAAIQAAVLASVKAEGTWTADGQRDFYTWLSSHTGSTRRTTQRSIRLSESLHEDLPETRRALADGAISSDHAEIIAQRCAGTEQQKQLLAHPTLGEAALVEQAKLMDATKFTKVAKEWSIKADPKHNDQAARRTRSKQELSLNAHDDGYYLSGFFDHVSGALIDEALRSHMGRKAADDQRTYNTRRADALVALVSQSLTFGEQLPSARIRPHLVVTVEYSTICSLIDASGPIQPLDAAGSEAQWATQWRPGADHVISTSLDYTKLQGIRPGTLPDGTPLPHRLLARIACESMLTRVVFGPESAVLNVGREQRIFTKPQTRAIIARDRHCQYPGCDVPATFGEIHHSISWAKHKGNTDVDLGILLCYHHHDVVHEREITITRTSGRWVFTTRRGHAIRPPQHSPRAPAAAPGRSGSNTRPPPRRDPTAPKRGSSARKRGPSAGGAPSG